MLTDTPTHKVLTFEALPVNDLKTLVVTVKIARTGQTIGAIRWARDWQQYAYWPSPGTALTRLPLIELRAKLSRLMYDWKRKKPYEPTRGDPVVDRRVSK